MKKKIAVIGAGLSGLSFAHAIKDQHNVSLFEKARGVGGRASTRVINNLDNLSFNHGALNVEVKEDSFLNYIKELENLGLFAVNNRKHLLINKSNNNIDIIESKVLSDNYIPRYNMNNICLYLSHHIDVHLNSRVTKIHYKDNKWHLLYDTKEKSEILDIFDSLCVSIPPEQAINLIDSSFKYHEKLKIKAKPCYTLMLALDKCSNVNFDYAKVSNSSIEIVNINKNPDSDLLSVVIQATHNWSIENLDRDKAQLTNELIQEFQLLVGISNINYKYCSLHLWRYGRYTLPQSDIYLYDKNINLGVCGDWLGNGNLESAYISGLMLANNMK